MTKQMQLVDLGTVNRASSKLLPLLPAYANATSQYCRNTVSLSFCIDRPYLFNATGITLSGNVHLNYKWNLRFSWIYTEE